MSWINKKLMDELDRKIMLELMRDSRQSLIELARKTSTTRQTVAKRIARMRMSGLWFTIKPDPKDFGLNLKAYILLRISPKGDVRRKCERLVKKIPNVQEFHYLLGHQDAILEVMARDHAELSRLIKRIHKVVGVKETSTLVVRETVKDDPAAPFFGVERPSLKEEM